MTLFFFNETKWLSVAKQKEGLCNPPSVSENTEQWRRLISTTVLQLIFCVSPTVSALKALEAGIEATTLRPHTVDNFCEGNWTKQ